MNCSTFRVVSVSVDKNCTNSTGEIVHAQNRVLESLIYMYLINYVQVWGVLMS